VLTYFLNDFEMVPVAPIITGITLVFTYYYYYYYSNDTLLKHSSRCMLTAQMSSSDSRNYAVPVSGTCLFSQPYFLYCLESAVEHNAFSHSTQANRSTADPVRAVTEYWEWRYWVLDVSSQLYASVVLAPDKGLPLGGTEPVWRIST
jgi:hypothetical protein